MNKKSFVIRMRFVLCCLLFGSHILVANNDLKVTSEVIKKAEVKPAAKTEVKKADIAKKSEPKEAKIAGDIKINDMGDFDGTVKIRVVNSFECMGECKDGKEARVDLEATRDVIGEGLKQEEQRLIKEVNKFKVEASSLTEDARKEKEKELLKMKRDFDVKVQESEEELKSTMQKRTESLARDFDTVVAEYGREHDIDIIADKVTGRIIFAANDFDITSDLIQKMDEKREIKIAQQKKDKAENQVMAKSAATNKAKTTA